MDRSLPHTFCPPALTAHEYVPRLLIGGLVVFPDPPRIQRARSASRAHPVGIRPEER